MLEAPPAVLPLRYPSHWKEYALLDSGNGLKWEKFGDRVLQRPEPQALWAPVETQAVLRKATQWRFEAVGGRQGQWLGPVQGDRGDRWNVNYRSPSLNLRFQLAMTAFKHVGLFPEQADNWEFIAKVLRSWSSKPKVLNLFAYTGGASLAAAAAGAQVYHLDSVRQVVDWARRNADLSGMEGLHWVVEDARKFVQREIKRGHVYDVVLMDPPAYGMGSSGERWKLEDQLQDLMEEVRRILVPQKHALLVNAYSLGLSPLILRSLLSRWYKSNEMECGETALQDRHGRYLPLGVYARVVRGLEPRNLEVNPSMTLV
ncbi:MAG: class I SAM-dependent methyltransferase [Bacteroidota bacterium]